MAIALYDKLRIRKNNTLLTINAPDEFKRHLGPLPANVKITASGNVYDQVHWFVQNKSQMEKEINKVLKLLKDDVIIWIYYPKGTSKLQTDLNRDKGWETLMKHGDHLTWISLISFDDTWSAFGLRSKTEADRKKEAKPKQQREVLEYVNPQTKEVRLPGELESAFKKNKKQAAFFDSLSFTNKREYIEWIVSAKREETRAERLKATIERLGKGWKNPANR